MSATMGNDFKILKESPNEISVIFWDVNGTITLPQGDVDDVIASKIIKLADKGVYQAFITGRDRLWLQGFLVKPIKEICEAMKVNQEKVLKNMGFYPELGLVSLEPPSLTPVIFEGIEDHPLISSSLRERIATLFWQEKSLREWKEGDAVPPRFYVSRDANKKGFLFPIVPQEIDVYIKLPDFIWSNSKELIGTAEVIREVDNRISKRRSNKINLAVKIIEGLLDYWDVKAVSVSPVSTAINFAPIVDGVALDKAWAVGRVLKQLGEQTGTPLVKIASRAVAIGDGKADFLFSQPIINGKQVGINISFVFVGSEKNYQPTEEQKKNVVIKPASEDLTGSRLTRKVLEFLEVKFYPL